MNFTMKISLYTRVSNYTLSSLPVFKLCFGTKYISIYDMEIHEETKNPSSHSGTHLVQQTDFHTTPYIL